MDRIWLQDMTWQEAEEIVAKSRGIILLPVGSVEQHGLHLPLGTDTYLAIGLAGGILSTFYYVIPEVGGRFCMLSFVIVVLGGFGSLLGTFLGGLIIGVAEEISAIFIPPVMKDVVAFILFLLILMLKPSGLFGEGGR